MAIVLVWTEAFFSQISPATAASLSADRETSKILNPARASWWAYSLPIPSDAPVTRAQLPLGPNERSYRYKTTGQHTAHKE